MTKKVASETKSDKTKSPIKVGDSQKVSKKKSNASSKSNTSRKKLGKKKATKKKTASKKAPKKSPKAPAGKKVSKSQLTSRDLGIPTDVAGTPILEILATSPKIAGVITQPRHRERENDWIVAVEVEDASRKLVQSIMSFPTGQHVVAIYIPIENATDAAEWFVLNVGMDLMQAPKQPDWEKREVSGKFLAWLFDVSDRRIQQINKEGHLHKTARGRYDFHRSVQLYIKHLKDEAAGKGGPELASEKLAIVRIEKKMKEIELGKKAGELINISEAKRAGFEFGNKIKATMQRWPAILSAPLAAAKTKKAARSILRAEIEKLLTNLSMEDMTYDDSGS